MRSSLGSFSLSAQLISLAQLFQNGSFAQVKIRGARTNQIATGEVQLALCFSSFLFVTSVNLTLLPSSALSTFLSPVTQPSAFRKIFG
jgi:hypothetical protein